MLSGVVSQLRQDKESLLLFPDEDYSKFGHFTYLGSVVDAEGRTKADVEARISKERLTTTQRIQTFANS